MEQAVAFLTDFTWGTWTPLPFVYGSLVLAPFVFPGLFFRRPKVNKMEEQEESWSQECEDAYQLYKQAEMLHESARRLQEAAEAFCEQAEKVKQYNGDWSE